MTKKKIVDIYPLSPTQEGMLFHYLLNDKSESYYEQLSLRLQGSLHLESLEQAWNAVIANNEVLRTVFTWDKSEKPLQVVLNQQPIKIEFHDLTGVQESEWEISLETIKEKDRQRGFDLKKGPLLRVLVCQLAHNLWEMIFSNHHILMDGWCGGIIFQELFTAYRALLQGKTPQLAPKHPFKEFIAYLKGLDQKEARRFWSEYLAEIEEPTTLFSDREGEGAGEVRQRNLVFSVELTEKIQALAKELQITISLITQAAWGLVLSRYTNQDQLTFGTTVSGRPAELVGVEEMVGLFINTVPTRMKLNEKMTGEELLLKLHAESIQRKTFENYPLVEIQNASGMKNEQDLFNTIFVFENFPLNTVSEELTPGFQVVGHSSFQTTNYALNLVAGILDTLHIDFIYNDHQINEESITRLMNHYQNILTDLTLHPNKEVRKLQLLLADEWNDLVHTLNQTQTDYPQERTVAQLFEEQVDRRPDGVAVRFGSQVMTYQELNEKANQLAHLLRKQGVGAETMVAVLLQRSFEMVVSLVAILKAGGAYVPMDPGDPTERIQFIVEDSGSQYLITQTNLTSILPQEIELERIYIDTERLVNEETSNLKSVTTPRNLAYVIYTSGSTGLPKGTLIEHRSINRLVLDTNYVDISPDDRILQLATYSFDAITFELWGALLNGARVVLIEKDDLLEIEKLAEFYQKEKITHTFITSSLFNNIADIHPGALRNLRKIYVGGEKMSPTHARKVFQLVNPGVLHNIYGPTENTTFSTYYPIEEFTSNRESIPIGKPISNSTAYILDQYLRPVPIGVVGELCLGGDGLSRGYLNRPELTAEKFIPHPFKEGEMLYRTGDLVKWLPDGNIDFIGRVDHQVKIRGFRIEPGEIEQILADHPQITQNLVVVKQTPENNAYLVAYFLAQRELATGELRKYLGERLPEYMIPKAFCQLDEMPLNKNGKVDRNRLPKPELGMGSEEDYLAPQNETEEKMAIIWEQVLGVPKVGIRDNFFDLGGDSIKAIQVVARMNKEGLPTSVKALFTHQTIEKLALYLGEGQEELVIEQGLVRGEQPLLPAQHWFFAENFARPDHWNLSILVRPVWKLKPEILQQALQELIRQHDALRLNYDPAMDGLRYIESYVGEEVSLREIDLSPLSNEKQMRKLEQMGTEINASMQLESGPLLRAGLFELGENGQRLLLAVHHLVVDGYSWRILLEDLVQLYQQLENDEEIILPAKTSSLKDWAEGLYGYSNSREIQEEIPYWQQVMEDFQPLPLDSVASAANMEEKDQQTQILRQGLDKEETEQLLTRCNQVYHTEMNDLLLTALARAVGQWIDGEKQVILLEGHGREEIIPGYDISRTVGWFTSIFPFTLRWRGEGDLARDIIQVKEDLRSLPQKGAAFGILKYLTGVAELQPELGKETLSFNYLGQFSNQGANTIFEIAEESAGWDVSPVNHRFTRLALNGMVREGEMEFICHYNPVEYHPETIQQFLDSYFQELRRIIQHCQNVEQGIYTPSDFPLVALDQEFLNGIDKSNVLDIYPLAPLQEGMLYHYVVGEDSDQYIQQMYMRTKGNIHLEHYRKAWEQVIKTHDVFRTRYQWSQLEKPVQMVYQHLPLQFQVLDFSMLDETEQTEKMEELRRDERQGQLDLAKGPTMKITVCQLGGQKSEIIWTYHHILIDGWCVGIIMRELLQAYQNLERGQTLPPTSSYPYRDYIKWLQNYDRERANEFWRQYLAGFDTPTSLPYDYKDQGHLAGFATQRWQIGREYIQGITEFVKEYKVTVNTLFQTIWGLLLQIYNQTDDVVFGATVSGRPPELKGVEEIVGLFINTIPIRLQGTGDTSLAEILAQMYQEGIERKEFENSGLPEIKAQSELTGQTQLFESILVFENYPIDPSLQELDLGFSIEDVDSFYVTNYDLTLVAMHHGEDIELSLQYSRGRFDAGTIERMLHHFQNVLKTFIDNPATLIKELDVLTVAEKERVLVTFNQTQVPCLEKNIHQVFEEQVKIWPDRIAVAYEDQSLTYTELNVQANRLARELQNRGVGRDTFVGMLMERSLDMIVGIFAILKAGGAYVPIRPDYPKERIAFMLEDSAAPLLLTQRSLQELIPDDYAGEVITVDQSNWSRYSAENLELKVNPRDLAYIIYTSGTTGRPKGVMIEHRNVIRLFKSEPSYYDFTETDVWTMFHSYCFDFSVWEIYGALLFGGKLVVVSKEDSMDTMRFLHLCQKHRVTVLNQTPAAFYNFIQAELENEKHTLNQHLRYVIFGGEALNFAKLIPWVELYALEEIALINMYGITETTVHVTYERIEKEDLYTGYRSLIGKPIYNTTIYLLDEWMRPVPIGVVGEIYVGGIGVARGYLNRPELSAEKFVPNPFVAGESLYRSGDLGRFTSDGNIEYLGRIDHQVKIRGFRIELGEIETALLKHPLIEEVVVLDRSDEQGNKYLVGYYVAEKELTVGELRDFLKDILPEYMIPALFVYMAEIPLTANGKVNRKGLPEPSGEVTTGENYIPPETDVETQIAQVWADVLGVEKVGMADNFYDLGGDSIKAIQVVARMNKLQLICQVKDIFTYQTIGQLALHVEKGSSKVEAEQGIITDEVDFLPIQRWFIDEDFADPHHWNQSLLLSLAEDVDVERLTAALRKVIFHHDGLRLTYQQEQDNLIYQDIDLESAFSLDRYDLSAYGREEQLAQIARLGQKLKGSFRIDEGLLVKGAIFELGANERRLLLTIHHLVVDGVSWRIILEDLAEAYGQLLAGKDVQLPLKTSSQKDWFLALKEYSETDELLAEIPYWEEALNSYQPLPMEKNQGMDTLASADAVIHYLDERETELLSTKVHNTYNTEMNDLLLAALIKAISKWTNDPEQLIHLEGHGRQDLSNRVDLSRTVGWFTSIYPIRLNLTGCTGIAEEIKEVKESLRQVPRKGIGFGILKYINQIPTIKDGPTADILFNYLGQFGGEMENQLFSPAEEETGMDAGEINHRPHLLEVNCMILSGRLRVAISYSTNRYNRETIEELGENYLASLRQIIDHCTDSGTKGSFTSSDFEMVDLEQDEIDNLFG